jgi:hypothetical protein
VLSKFYQLREEITIVFTSEESELADLLSDEIWCNKVAFLADISQALNNLKKNILVKNENILTCTYKINSFQEELTLWGVRIIKENKVEMVKLTKICRLENTPVDLILQNLSLPRKNIEKYFSSFDISSLDCVRDPFVLSAFESAE